jgi:hypothetical protein
MGVVEPLFALLLEAAWSKKLQEGGQCHSDLP